MAVRIESQAEPIPGYKLVERLGGGGFGEVWKAIAPGGIFKAIKFVYGDLETAGDDGQRAEQELKALSRVKAVRHPYILSLERYDIIDGQLMIVMELADRNLWDRFRECRDQGLTGIPRDELLRYMDEAAEALDLMNEEHQLQHLDIKPQNLFLVHNHAKVADFGLVKDLEGMMAAVTGGVTPVYAAPETFDGWVSRFCDQYSLAIVYQELLTGQRPFTGNNVRQLILQHLQAAPNLELLPSGDQAAIGQALAKNPDQRHANCRALVRALQTGVVAKLARPETEEASPPAGQPRESVGDQEASADLQKTPTGTSPAALTPHSFPQPGSTQWMRVKESRPAPAELPPQTTAPEGEGILFPTLVIGLGKMGLRALQRLRRNLNDELGHQEGLPTLRLLYLDTDPEASKAASEARPGPALAPKEVLLARLHRPSHYLRPREGQVRLEPWFNRKMLYRIPRTLQTTGMRSLGRLAFLDNIRSITRRLRAELNACTKPEAIKAAENLTGYGLYRRQPRIYVVTSLAGGTGSGMFVDLAYLLRDLLKLMGHERSEVVGIFLLPQVSRQAARVPAVANTFAALTELEHFSRADTVFNGHQGAGDKPLHDQWPPFCRAVFLPMPERNEDGRHPEAAEAAGEVLFREIATSLGKLADHLRCTNEDAGEAGKPSYETVGMVRLSWPRATLIRSTAQRLCAQLIERWMTKETTSVHAAVELQAGAFWEQEHLGGEQLLKELELAAAQTLGRPPESAFAALMEQMQQAPAQTQEQYYSLLSELQAHMERIVGRPDENIGTFPAILAQPLAESARALIASCGEKLSRFVVSLIERPCLRLAGAEEAVRVFIDRFEKELQRNEPLRKELSSRADEAYGRIHTLLETLRLAPSPNKKTANTIPNLIELIGVYPKWRYQALVLQSLGATLLSVRGNLSDQLREINFCRSRLAEMLRTFREQAGKAAEEAVMPLGRFVFPGESRTLEEGIDALVREVTAEQFQELDNQVQGLIEQQFTGLVHVCLTPSNLLRKLEAAMQHEAEAFLGNHLAGVSVLDMYLDAHDSEAQAEEDLADLFEKAAPKMGQDSAGEITIVAAPNDPAAGRFDILAHRALPDVNFQAAFSRNDIIVYRERLRWALSELEQLGPQAYEAYCHIAAAEHCSPHSRLDIEEWLATHAPPQRIGC
jgi:serine/threonine protein kinase